MLGAFSAALRSSATTLILPGMISRVGSKMFSRVTVTGLGSFLVSSFSPALAFLRRFFFFRLPFWFRAEECLAFSWADPIRAPRTL
jgi:hypothetical protein